MRAFVKIEPVRFGDFEATPDKLTAETKLRLQNLKFETEDQIQEAKNLLAGCFGAQAQQVKEFMEDNMFPSDLVDLQVYLTQGPQGYEDMKEGMKEVMVETMRKAAEKHGAA